LAFVKATLSDQAEAAVHLAPDLPPMAEGWGEGHPD
jgi:hypothetical protein